METPVKGSDREKWTNEAARILWWALDRGDSTGRRALVRIERKAWNERWFREGETSQASITSLGNESDWGPTKRIDIAVLLPGTPGEVLALIEVEESREGPADLRKDWEGMLRGCGIEIDGVRDWNITPRTKLIVLFKSINPEAGEKAKKVEKEARDRRNELLRKGCTNASIENENIIIQPFRGRNPKGAQDLKERLQEVMYSLGLGPVDCMPRCDERTCQYPEKWESYVIQKRVSKYFRDLQQDQGLGPKEAAEAAGVNRATLRSTTRRKGAFKNPAIARELAAAPWGRPVIDFYIRACQDLNEEDVPAYIKWLQNTVGQSGAGSPVSALGEIDVQNVPDYIRWLERRLREVGGDNQ